MPLELLQKKRSLWHPWRDRGGGGSAGNGAGHTDSAATGSKGKSQTIQELRRNFLAKKQAACRIHSKQLKGEGKKWLSYCSGKVVSSHFSLCRSRSNSWKLSPTTAWAGRAQNWEMQAINPQNNLFSWAADSPPFLGTQSCQMSFHSRNLYLRHLRIFWRGGKPSK